MSLEEYAPKPNRMRQHRFGIRDLSQEPFRMTDGTPVPQVGRPRPSDEPQNLDELEADMRALYAQQGRQPPATSDRDAPPLDENLPEKMVAQIKDILKRLPYGTMKIVGAEIGKLAGIEGPKQSDALHAWATDEKPAP